MTRKHYIMLSEVMGNALAIALLTGGESARTETYNECYLPLALALKEDNPAFDELKFSAAVGFAESSYLTAAKECGRQASDTMHGLRDPATQLRSNEI